MIPTSIARAPTFLRSAAPALRPIARPHQGSMVVAKRFNQMENRGGRSKLIFRFGLKDVPVELYPIAFITACALAGACFAIGRHLYLDGPSLRIFPEEARQRNREFHIGNVEPAAAK